MLLRAQVCSDNPLLEDSAGEEVDADCGAAEEELQQSLSCCTACCVPLLLLASHHECWSLNGQNRLGAHEWPAGGGCHHLLVLLHSTSIPLLLSGRPLLASALPQQPFLAVCRGTERTAAVGHESPLGVGAGAALGGSCLVARLCSVGDPP